MPCCTAINYISLCPAVLQLTTFHYALLYCN